MASQSTPMFPRLLHRKPPTYASALAVGILAVVVVIVLVGITNLWGSSPSPAPSEPAQAPASSASPTEQKFLTMAKAYGVPLASDTRSLERGREVCRVLLTSGDREGRFIAAGMLRPDLPSGSEDRFVQVALYSGLCADR